MKTLWFCIVKIRLDLTMSFNKHYYLLLAMILLTFYQTPTTHKHCYLQKK